ncbi:hypothetical protein A3D62_01900 [Candidatus Kaiserbacteria bacterium RIFCSPHIGHO2_02_FULL_49_11]|uniref:RHS repeat-associated core domain-containing protein n=1 Tax=Candidatus Kaiserbacteria bacterium RIFCSPHIGHO2_02_FULL_49_11 TaxID=1798489 RepID=A0A1F6D1L9_9BACT|nr:MAG: hypothetical protein A3D62_01900 [Candidatus Kaiserbacteria bacterium RIFCSPHIGHO2_02_FULL_49_11]
MTYSPTATSTYFNHPDHLGGANIVTDSSGDLAQTLDYYPFGAQRVNTKAGNFDEQYKFTGHEQDEDTDLTYAKQRYYGQDYGRFLSVDPVVQNLGMDTRTPLVLKDPQLQNSYSYVRNNPLILTDPDGENPIVIGLGIAGIGFGGTYYGDVRENQRQGLTGLVQFAPREGFISRGVVSTADVAIGFFAENPLVSGVSAGSASLIDDYRLGQPFDFGDAGRDAAIGFGSDLILGPFKDASASVKRDLAKIFSSGALNLGAHEFIRNTQQPQSPVNQSAQNSIQQDDTTYYRNKEGLLSSTPQD